MTDNIQLRQTIERLEQSLRETRSDFLERISGLQEELTAVKKTLQEERSETAPKASVPVTETMNVAGDTMVRPQPVCALSGDNSPEKIIHQGTERDVTAAVSTTVNRSEKPEGDSSSQTETANQGETSAKGQARWTRVLAHFLGENVLEILLSFVLSSVSFLSAPFQRLFGKVFELYHHYQKQGKAPAFLMTVAGLLTLIFGFGYLLQYSFSTVFNDLQKVLCGFLLGGIVVVLGSWMARRRVEFKEYAASLIALGIVFLYLTSYFAGPYLRLFSEPLCFGVLLLITMGSFLLALFFETRVVSAVTLVGGVLIPFVFGETRAVDGVFLAYLLGVAAANLFLAARIQWSALAAGTFVLIFSVLEYTGLDPQISPVLALGVLSAFFYLYTYNWTFNGRLPVTTISRQALTILVANLFYFLYVAIQVPINRSSLAGILVGHVFLLALVIRQFGFLKTVLAPVYFLLMGVLGATAIFLVSPADVSGTVWALEGLAMVYIGFQYRQKMIRLEGYAVYLLAMCSSLWHIYQAFVLQDPAALNWHWLNLLLFGGFCWLAYRLIQRFPDEATVPERQAAYWQNEVFTLWGAVALWTPVAVFWEKALGVAVLGPIIWCFYRVPRHGLRWMQGLGFLLMLAFPIQLLVGMLVEGHAIVSGQSFYSLLALVEGLLLMWGGYLFYQRFELKGRGLQLSRRLHQLFFLSPLVLVGLSVLNVAQRHGPNHHPLQFSGIWWDGLIITALLVSSYYLLKYVPILGEESFNPEPAYILQETTSLFSGLFFLYTAAILGGSWMLNLAIIPLFALLYRGLKKQLPLTEKMAWAYFCGPAITLLNGFLQTGSFYFAIQPLQAQLGAVEILLAAWALPLFYQHFDYQRGWQLWARRCRTTVYVLIPLLLLPSVLRLYPNYVPTALWGAFLICWLMYKKLQEKALRLELKILCCVGMVLTVLKSLQALLGESPLAGLLAVIAGSVALAVFHFIEKTLSQPKKGQVDYALLQLLSPYFYGFVVGSLSYAGTHNFGVALVLMGGFFVYLSGERRFRGILRDSLKISYGLSWLLLGLLPLLVFFKIIPEQRTVFSLTGVVLTELLACAGLWRVTHSANSSLSALRRVYWGSTVQLWGFNILVMLGYLGILNILLFDWSVATTIALLIHAVVVLFLTLQKRFQGLLRLSIALYGLTALKVLFYDLSGFGILHKVIALMGIGTILMGAAYFYQKRRGRLCPQILSDGEEKDETHI